MGDLIDEEDCPVCEEFDQEWIFTYGDLVTLLLCFFILLFSLCEMNVETFDEVAQSFNPMPPASSEVIDGKDTIVEKIIQQLEISELAEDTDLNVEDRGLVISFKSSALFEPESAALSADAKKKLTQFATLLYLQPNKIQLEGHTDNLKPQKWKSNWALSGARASAVAKFLVSEGVDGKQITAKAFADQRPQFRNDSPQQRILNNRVELIIIPDS